MKIIHFMWMTMLWKLFFVKTDIMKANIAKILSHFQLVYFQLVKVFRSSPFQKKKGRNFLFDFARS